MSPLVASAIIMLAYVVSGTLVGTIVLFIMSKPGKVPDPTIGKAATAAFTATLIGGAFYGILVKFLDNSSQPLINPAFYIGCAAFVGVSYLVMMKSFDVEPGRIPILWAPYAAVLVGVLFVVRTQGTELREKLGFYRGYEKFAHLNMLDPPDAMSTPERAVNFYIQQYKALKNANEDSGIGKLLTTSTHWDAKWFNDNYEFMTMKQQESDPFGITKVVTDPKAHRVFALAEIAKPLFGRVDKAAVSGNEAVVRMTSGQIVRLYKEGRNWKVREWLGMRAHVTKAIAPVKEKHGGLTPEEEQLKADRFMTYENETKALCEKLGIEYTPFDPTLDEEDFESGPDGKLRKKTEKLGIAGLENAKAGELVDLSEQEQKEPLKVAAGPRSTATPIPALPSEPNIPQVTIPEGQPSSVPTPGPAIPAPEQVVPDFVAPSPQQSPAVPIAPTIDAFYVEGAPIETLWPQYQSAVQKIAAGDVSGVRAFENVMSDDDVAWLQANHAGMAELLTPGSKYETPEASKLLVLQAMLRNMPANPDPQAKVSRKQALAVAQIKDQKSGLVFTTALVQEKGRWVLAHMFFVRDFVWVPQLAYYKKVKALPLTAEEQAFLNSGYAPFQMQVRTVFQMVGFAG